MSRQLKLVMLNFFILITLTACDGQQYSLAQTLAGNEWELIQLNGDDLIFESKITLQFENRRVTGFAGCNSYTADYHSDSSGSLSIPEVARTLLGCSSPAGVIDQENAYLEALWTAATYQIANETLEIRNSEDTVTLVFTKE
ncbi:MAG: META domain-containing protein [Chloroflexota bacterium]